MRLYQRSLILIAVTFFYSYVALSQDQPIGYWRSLLPYNASVGIAANGSNIFVITEQALFTMQTNSFNPQPLTYSKVSGMSDVGMKSVAYDNATSTAVLVYINGNVDLFKDKENTFYNLPDFKTKSISGTKSVSKVFAENGKAFISTSIGIIVVNLTEKEVKETYQFIKNSQTLAVNDFKRSGHYYYAVTTAGIYRADTGNQQLQNFQVWQVIDTIPTLLNVAAVNNDVYFSDQKSVYTLMNDTLHFIYQTPSTDSPYITSIDGGLEKLIISEFKPNVFKGDIKLLDVNGTVTDSFTQYIGAPMQSVQLPDSSIWLADNYTGTEKVLPNGAISRTPHGPSKVGCYDILASNKEVWVAHGGYDDELFLNVSQGGVSKYNDDAWKYYKQFSFPGIGNMDAFVALAHNKNTGDMYMGSFQNGLFVLHPDETSEVIYSPFDTSKIYFGDNQRQIAGLGLDKTGNLWVTTAGSFHQLYAKTENGWNKFYVPGNINGGPMVIDDNGVVWFVALPNGGVVVYDAGGTIEDASDDVYYRYTTGVGSGNLPSNRVYCIARDHSNSIWVGTDNGIGIISNCGAANPCDGQIPIVQYDKFAGYLFAGSSVRTIAVDGGNRKWVGTDDGVWLLSSDAQKIIYRFTVENSPMPSNHVKKISIDDVTGDVYIGTEEGLVSYRSTATEGGTSNQNVEIFPNPVKSDYTGTIAIKGLVANADVRITDIAGHLVFKTKAYGGQAVWNGLDYTGHRPQSGVYLVLATSSDGSQTYSGKIVFVQ